MNQCCERAKRPGIPAHRFVAPSGKLTAAISISGSYPSQPFGSEGVFQKVGISFPISDSLVVTQALFGAFDPGVAFHDWLPIKFTREEYNKVHKPLTTWNGLDTYFAPGCLELLSRYHAWLQLYRRSKVVISNGAMPTKIERARENAYINAVDCCGVNLNPRQSNGFTFLVRHSVADYVLSTLRHMEALFHTEGNSAERLAAAGNTVKVLLTAVGRSSSHYLPDLFQVIKAAGSRPEATKTLLKQARPDAAQLIAASESVKDVVYKSNAHERARAKDYEERKKKAKAEGKPFSTRRVKMTEEDRLQARRDSSKRSRQRKRKHDAEVAKAEALGLSPPPKPKRVLKGSAHSLEMQRKRRRAKKLQMLKDQQKGEEHDEERDKGHEGDEEQDESDEEQDESDEEQDESDAERDESDAERDESDAERD